MSATVPSSDEIYTQIINSLETELGTEVPVFKKAFLRVISVVLAGVLALLYRFSNALALDMFPQTATYGAVTLNGKTYNPLELLAISHAVPLAQAAIPARHTITITFTGNGTIDKGTYLVGKVNRIKYVTEDVVVQSAGAGSRAVGILAIEDSKGNPATGASGTLAVGDILTFATKPSFTTAEAVAASVVQPGEDAETPIAFRTRVVNAIADRLKGGSLADIRQWAVLTPQVSRVFPYAGYVPGSVDVYVEVNDQPEGIPTQAQLEAVETSIRYVDYNGTMLAERSPVNLLPIAKAITKVSFSVHIASFSGVDNVDYVKLKVEDALQQFFDSCTPVCPGLTILPRNDVISTSAVSGIVQKVVQYFGGYAGGIELRDSAGSLIDIYQLTDGQLAKLTGVTWV